MAPSSSASVGCLPNTAVRVAVRRMAPALRAAAFLSLAVLAGCGAPAAPSPPASAARSSVAKPPASPSGSSAKPAASGSLKANIVVATNFIYTLPLIVASDRGILARNGLDASITRINVGANSIASLLSGDAQVLYTSADAMAARMKGAPLKYLFASTTTLSLYMYGQPDIPSIEALRGKKIGVTGRGTATEAGMLYLLDKHGLKAGDVNIVSMGQGEASVTALLNRSIDAAVFGPDFTTANAQGLKRLGDTAGAGWVYPSAWATATESTVSQQPELLRRILRAQVEGAAMIARDRAMAVDVIHRKLDIPDDAVAQQLYDTYQPLYARAPYPSSEALQAALDQMAATTPEANSAKPADFIDDHFVRELDASGAIAQLWQ
jgi:NitT/TauT family transport system substrate-binding protein